MELVAIIVAIAIAFSLGWMRRGSIETARRIADRCGQA
jgi:hypothetical protein